MTTLKEELKIMEGTDLVVERVMYAGDVGIVEFKEEKE